MRSLSLFFLSLEGFSKIPWLFENAFRGKTVTVNRYKLVFLRVMKSNKVFYFIIFYIYSQNIYFMYIYSIHKHIHICVFFQIFSENFQFRSRFLFCIVVTKPFYRTRKYFSFLLFCYPLIVFTKFITSLDFVPFLVGVVKKLYVYFKLYFLYIYYR